MKHFALFLIILTLLSCTERKPNNPFDPQVNPSAWAPTNLTITILSVTSIRLNWKDSCTVEEGFKVERKTASGSYTVIATVNANTVQYTDTNLAQNTLYTYRVMAYAGTNFSSYTSEVSITLPDNFVYIPGGSFTMGDTRGQGSSNELPTHTVTLNSFYIGRYEVTQAEWQSVMGTNPASGYGVGANYPVYYVSWYATLVYCNFRSMNEGLTPVYTINNSTNPNDWGAVPTSNNATWNAAICNWNANGYRLSTEAEWEYAARGATNTPDYLYSGSDDINAVAWYYGNNTPYGSKPVGGKAANGLGIFDMSGNVWEWCWDWYGSYSASAQTNPTGPASGSYRLLRGGCWPYNATYCRVSNRDDFNPCYGGFNVGFRLCRAN